MASVDPEKLYPWVFGAGAVGLLALYLVLRRSQEQPSVAPVAGYDTFAAAPDLIALAPVPTITEPATNLIIRRLSSSEAARQIFAFQSAMYSWRATEYTPDGLLGPLTRSLIKRVNSLPGVWQPSDAFDPSMLQKGKSYLLANYVGRVTPRVIPYRLPRNVIDAVNRSIHQVMPEGPVLQVEVLEPAA
jgi:hypothetical protein